MVVSELPRGTDFREIERLGNLRADLRACMGLDFDLWRCEGNSWWRVSREALEEFDEAGTDRAQQLHEVVKSPESVVMLSDPDGHEELALKFTEWRCGPVVAVSATAAHDSDALVRLSRLFIKHWNTQDELLSLRQEQHAFLCQVTNDFEEQTFLRSMANLLEVSDLTFGLEAMAKTILPTLQPLIQAQALILVGAVSATAEASGATDSQEIDVSSPLHWTGPECISVAVCTALVRRYRQLAATQPVVKNYFRRLPEAAKFPGIEGFILVPIANGEITIGWLLALNRCCNPDLQLSELPWEMAYLEFGSHEATLLSSSAAILATQARNVQLFREREELLVNVVRALVSAVEAKDEYTRGHSERVGLYGRRIAQEMGLDSQYCEKLYLAGLLHDIGKIGIRDAVLRKPGMLTADELEEVKRHPDKGWQILQDLEQLNYVMNGVLYHHEQFDGKGYPDQLSGQRIPLEGRILAVADAYDAMTSDRPYRPGMPSARAEAILRSGAGRQWDPQVVDAFFRCLDSILTIKSSYQPPTPRQRRRVPANLELD